MPPKKTRGNDGGRGNSDRGRGRGRGSGREEQLDEGQPVSKKRRLNALQRLKAEELDELSDTQTAPQTAILTVQDIIQSKGTKVTAHSRHFKDLVLVPRRITTVKNNGPYMDPYDHFLTTAPPPGNLLDYTTIKGLDAAEVWISLSDNQVDRIIKAYRCMTNRQVCEQEYASFATEKFFRGPERDMDSPIDRKWRAERMLQLVSPPTDSFEEPCSWEAPPSFEESPEFKFDLRPDCSYWLSLTGFNPDYRSELMTAVYVHGNDWITCPYFTIEFKKHDQSKAQALWQACAAASMALYNRYLLKHNALAVGAEEWTDLDRAQMKHYVLTFVGSLYNIWVLRARLSGDSGAWDGCSITNICCSMCTTKGAVRKLESWINEIHRWGLSVHAASCQADVKTILGDNDIDI
jgi:hypothetical protein